VHQVLAQGIKKGTDTVNLIRIIREFALKIFDNLNWLKRGETVLIKLPVNSIDPYPATGHVLALTVLVHLIKQKGGIPFVGDQSGIEYVLQGPNGVVRGSTHQCFKQSGLWIDGVKYIAFENDAWRSFKHFQDPNATNWPGGFHVTRWINEVDHIIALPRISAHGQSGVTLGAKNWVGILRQDSRLNFHAQGPLYFYITYKAIGSNLHAERLEQLDFFKMITEIQLAIQSKLRGTMFIATEVQTTMGPNKFLLNELGINFFRSHVVKPETGLLIGSQDPVACDAVALAFLFDCYKHTPKMARFWQRLLMAVTGNFKELGTYSVWDNPFISHGLELDLGQKITNPHDPNQLSISDAPDLDRRIIDILT